MNHPKNDVIQALEDVKKTLSKGWCRGTFAKDKYERPTNPHCPEASQWCLMGAMMLAENVSFPTLIVAARSGLRSLHPTYEGSLMDLNDFLAVDVKYIHTVLDESIRLIKNKTQTTT